MPGGDRTGPLGQGPMTGRAMGLCAGYDGPGYLNPGYGGGRGMGYGGGRGFGRGMAYRRGRGGWGGGGGWGWNPVPVPAPATTGAQPPAEDLRALVLELQGELAAIRQRLDDIQK